MNILNKLTIKHLTMNKKRTIVTIIGVLLSCALMVGIGLLFATVREYAIKEVEQSSGSHHIKIYSLNKEQLEKLSNHKTVDKVLYEKGIGFAILEGSQNEYKPYLYINSVNQNFLKNLTLLEGRLPENDREVVISSHIKENGKVELKIGQTLDLEVGNRYFDGHMIATNSQYLVDEENSIKEELIPDKKLQYKIVGIVKRHHSESYEAAGYSVFTLNQNLEDNDLVNAYVEFKSVKNVYDKTHEIAELLGLEFVEREGEYIYSNISFNSLLLGLYGVSNYANFTTAMSKIIVIMLSLVSIGCIMVIYNSFAISVMERKKQFGLFSSIGATKRQIRKTVFYEAFIIGLIGIPLGLISGFIGIGIVLQVINYLLTDIFQTKLTLSFYPLFIIIPLIFMVIVILISAFLPARSASKVSPIQAIRLNDDIKINPKKVKSPRFIQKLFGIEGQIAYKNMKRNKKKYRITLLSLFVSLVMFISFSSFLQYGQRSTVEFLESIDYDVIIHLSAKNDNVIKQMLEIVKKQEGFQDTLALERFYLITSKLPKEKYHDDYQEIIKLYEKQGINLHFDEEFDSIIIYKVDDDSYNEYKKQLNLKENQPILINTFKTETYFDNKRVKTSGKYLKDVKSLEIELCYHEDESMKCFEKINNMAEMDFVPFGFKSELYNNVSKVILPKEQYDKIVKKYYELLNITEHYDSDQNIFIKTNKPKELQEALNQFEDHPDLNYISITNVVEQMRMERNLILVIKILLYGFISLVTLIGVTSVFNTINTSVALRRKEFAVLRSVGLSPNGFNKMMRFEILILGLKSLLYAIPVSLGVIMLIHNASGEVVNLSTLLIPWNSIVVAIFGLFAIISITMIYATKKIKHENILDAIREENI